MGQRSRFVVAFGVALGVASCGGGHEQPPPGSYPGSGGRAGSGGTGSGGPDGGTSSPLPFIAPGASFAPGSICEADGWCWIDPLPSGAWWQGIAGVDRSEVWIGGMSQDVLHFTGGHWGSMISPLVATQGIWASAPNDVWFGGIAQPGVGGIAHWDGQAISVVVSSTPGSGEIDDLWASGPNDVYAAGIGVLEHWDGSAWSVVPGVAGSSISGSGSADIWVATFDGLWHFDGTAWSRVPKFETQFVQSVAVAGPNDVWVAVLHDGMRDVDHFDGTSWTTTLSLGVVGQPALQALGIGVNGDVWLVGTAFEAIDERGYLARFDKRTQTWSVGADAPTPLVRVTAVPGIGDLAVGRNGGILLLSPTSPPTFTDLRSGPEEDLTGVWGSSPTDMWAAGRAGTLLHFDGQHVNTVPTGVTVDLTDVWGTAPDDVWIVGRGGTALHFDGASLQPVATGTTADLLSVFTATRGDVWMGGSGATLLRIQNGSVAPAALPGVIDTAAILDLHGLASDDVWLTGGPEPSVVSNSPGFVAHFDGTSWSAIDPLTLNNGGFPVHRIWALAPNDVWAFTQPLFRDLVGYWHFDGTTWTEMDMPDSPTTFMFPRPADAFSTFVFGPHDRWVVGALGAWLHSTQ